MKKILSYKKSKSLYICNMQYYKDVRGIAYMIESDFRITKLEEKLNDISPKLLHEFRKCIEAIMQELNE